MATLGTNESLVGTAQASPTESQKSSAAVGNLVPASPKYVRIRAELAPSRLGDKPVLHGWQLKVSCPPNE